MEHEGRNLRNGIHIFINELCLLPLCEGIAKGPRSVGCSGPRETLSLLQASASSTLRNKYLLLQVTQFVVMLLQQIWLTRIMNE